MTEGKTVVLDNQQFLLARPKEMVYLTTNSFFCVKKSLLIRGTFKAFTFNYETENKPLDQEGVTLGPRATFGPKRQIFIFIFYLAFLTEMCPERHCVARFRHIRSLKCF